MQGALRRSGMPSPGLKPGTRYVFQVRARTSAGCGRPSQAMVETRRLPVSAAGRQGHAQVAKVRGMGLVGAGLCGNRLACSWVGKKELGLREELHTPG